MSTVLVALDESGADASTTFDDKSASNHTITANGNFQWDTAQAPTGQTSSGLSDGTADYLQISSHADFGFGTGDFTMEAFVRFASLGASAQIIFDLRDANNGPVLFYDGANIVFYAVGAAQIAATPPSVNTWVHIAAAKSGSSTKLFIDGTQGGSTYTDSNNYGSANACRIAESKDGAASLNGWICSVRIDKGTALYTANFTPPSLPLVTGTGTEALSGIASSGAAGTASPGITVAL